MVKVLGILNLTSDSFSDGGRYLRPAAAISHAERMARDGAWAIDVGAEATNPKAAHLTAEEEIARLAAVVPALQERGLRVSLDTYKPAVMEWGVQNRIEIINDVTGWRDQGAIDAVRNASGKLIVMHSRARGPHAEIIDADPTTLVDDILAFFRERIATLTTAAVAPERLILDPGMGLFIGRSAEVSFTVLRELARFKSLGPPLLISTSRKSFLAAALEPGQPPRPPPERGAATLATELWAAIQGVDFIRTHDVRALVDGLAVLERILAPATGERSA